MTPISDELDEFLSSMIANSAKFIKDTEPSHDVIYSVSGTKWF